ncbi:MAG: hypothetical protein NTV97_02470 [Alphaproteobacteria bacterium]|nr:hypothetical protein [Alphaproteobacteria bacterium]
MSMNSPQTIETLAVSVCRAVRNVREDNQAWIGIDCLNEFLRIDDAQMIDAALAFASAKGWLSLGGRPAHSVLLNRNAP